MADDVAALADKEEKRRKIKKRMNKIIVKAWNIEESDMFQLSPTKSPSDTEVRDLTDIGKNLDKGIYQHGRSGWEMFAKDMGLVYNWHIVR